MDFDELSERLSLPESRDLEYKSAKGGLPGNMWETYSAMANTDGGTIVLGVAEKNGLPEIQGIENLHQIQKRFWDCIHNRNCVSACLLSEDDTQVVEFEGKKLFLIHIPRATRYQRPVFVGQNPQTGTFRRRHEGDYKCTPETVAGMMADRSRLAADARILPGYTEEDLDSETLRQYRNRFSARNPVHPWLNEDSVGFLQKLGGWRSDKTNHQEGFTVAGILMFGNENAITELGNSLKFNLDYRERTNEFISDRWTDRFTIDGTWTPNLFQFYQKVYPKLTEGIKLPFSYLTSEQVELFPDPVRSGMSPVHEAIQEALVNALIHADYSGAGGIVLERFSNRLELSNPGTLLVSQEQLRQGAVSECRNPALQKMFQMIGAGDRAGSGMDKIRRGWASQKWREPQIFERQTPDRVILKMPMLSLLPPETVNRLKEGIGKDFSLLTPDEVHILVIADEEGKITNERVQQFSPVHPTDITKIFQHLVSLRLLTRYGYGRWAFYTLSVQLQTASLPDSGSSLPDSGSSLPDSGASLPDSGSSLPDSDLSIQEQIAQSVREKKRLEPAKVEAVILELCRNRFLTIQELADILKRNPKYISDAYLKNLVQTNRLELKFPASPQHPAQAYRTVK